MKIKKKLCPYNRTEEEGEGNPTSFPPDNDASSTTQAGHQLAVQEYQQLATMYHCSISSAHYPTPSANLPTTLTNVLLTAQH